jgi:hypothetical protein
MGGACRNMGKHEINKLPGLNSGMFLKLHHRYRTLPLIS